MSKTTRNFRRYNNRKIYDLDKRSYVNLTDLVAAVRDGHDVTVTLHGTNKDVTKRTLVEAINRLSHDDKTPSYETLTGLIKSLSTEGPQ